MAIDSDPSGMERTLRLVHGLSKCPSQTVSAIRSVPAARSLLFGRQQSQSAGSKEPTLLCNHLTYRSDGSRRANKIRKPTSCVNEGKYPVRFRVWIKNGNPQSFSSAFTCFLPSIDSDRRRRKFENGDGPICMCEDAAGEMDIVR